MVRAGSSSSSGGGGGGHGSGSGSGRGAAGGGGFGCVGGSGGSSSGGGTGTAGSGSGRRRGRSRQRAGRRRVSAASSLAERLSCPRQAADRMSPRIRNLDCFSPMLCHCKVACTNSTISLMFGCKVGRSMLVGVDRFTLGLCTSR